MFNATGQDVHIRVRDVIGGDAEHDVAVVAEDRDPSADRARDRDIGNDLLEAASHPVERLAGTRHVRRDRDDFPLWQRENPPDQPGGQQVRAVAAQGGERLADDRLVARLQGIEFGPDGGQPFHRVVDLHGKIGHGRGNLVPEAALVILRPDGNRDQRRNLVRLQRLAPLHQERTETAADRGQHDIVDRAAEFALDCLDVIQRRPCPGVPSLLADVPAERRRHRGPQGRVKASQAPARRWPPAGWRRRDPPRRRSARAPAVAEAASCPRRRA